MWAINCLLYRKLKEHLKSRKNALNWSFKYSVWARRIAQNLYYDVTGLAPAAQCRETWQGDTTFGGRHEDLSSLHVTSLDQSYFFIRHINYMRYNTIHLLPSLEGDMKICSTQRIHVARGRHEFSWLNKSACLPINWAIKCLLYRKLKENLLSRKHALDGSFAYFGMSFSVSETRRAKHVLWRHSPQPPQRSALRHDRETRRLEGDMKICLLSTWLL